MTNLVRSTFLLLIAASFLTPLQGRDWSDLDEPEVHGSEAEGHYPFNLGYLAYYESWKNERGESLKSIHFFFLWRLTYYPKYESSLISPLYYHLQSKIDAREMTILFPLYYGERTDKKNSLWFTPIFGSYLDDGDSTSWIGPFYSGGSAEKRTARRGLFPLLMYSGKGDQSEMTILPLLSYFEWGPDRSTHLFPLIPFIHYYSYDKKRAETTFYLIPGYYSKEQRKEKTTTKLHVFPLYFSGSEEGPSSTEEFNLFLPLLYHDSITSETRSNATTMLPVVPLVYYHSVGKNRYRSYDTLWLPGYFSWNDRSPDNDTYSKGRLTPILFYSSEAKDRAGTTSYNANVLLLFNYSSDENPSTGQRARSYSFLPFFFVGNDKDRAGNESSFLWLLVTYSSSRENAEAGTRSSTTIIPLVYSNSASSDSNGRTSSYTNVLLLGNGSSSTNKETGASSSSYSFFPLYYTGSSRQASGTTSDSTWALLYYGWNDHNVEKNADSSGNFFLPLYYTASRKDGRQESSSLTVLLFNQSASKDLKSGANKSSWTVFPFVRRQSATQADGKETSSFWSPPISWWDEVDEDERSSGSLVPLLFFNTASSKTNGKASSYTNYLLLGNLSSSSNRETGTASSSHSFVPIYFRSNSKDGNGSTSSYTNVLLLGNGSSSTNKETGASSSSYSFFPLFYTGSSQQASGTTSDSTWALVYYGWNDHNVEKNADSSGKWFFPLYYAANRKDERQESSSMTVFIVNRSTSKDLKTGANKSSWTVFPFLRAQSATQADGKEKSSFWSPLTSWWDEVDEDERSSGSLVPLLFFNTASSKKNGQQSAYRNVALLYNQHSSIDQRTGKSSSLYSFFPLFYAGRSQDEKGNLSASRWLLFWYDWDRENPAAGAVSSGSLIPVVFFNSSSSDKQGKASAYTNVLLFGNASSSVDKETGATSSSYSLIPLYYTNASKSPSGSTSSYTNVLLLGNTSSSVDKETGATKASFSILPLYYSGSADDGKGTRSDTKWAWIYYAGRSKEASGSYSNATWFLPYFGWNRYDSQRNESSSGWTFAPFFYQSASKNQTSGQEKSSYAFFPFFHTSSAADEAGNASTSFWLIPYFSWDKNGKDAQSSGSLFPIVYYTSSSAKSNGKSDEFTNILLFWNSSSSFDKETGHFSETQHLLPLYYRSAKQSENDSTKRLWFLSYYDWDLHAGRDDRTAGAFFLPVYYHSEKKDSSFYMITPLYWSSENPESKEITRLSPVHYGHRWKEDGTERYTNWTLNSFGWNHGESEGYTFFPFYYRIKDQEKEWELYAMGAVTTADAMLHTRGDSIFLDTDTYVGYGLVGRSSRIPVYDRGAFKRWIRGSDTAANTPPDTTADKTSEPTMLGEEKAASVETANGPRVHKDRSSSFDRENSSSYSKWQVLFGWVTSIQADTRHHVRFLPLAWVSWDDANENDYLTYVPFAYLDYQTPEEHYRAVFPLFLPFYGRYDKGKSYTVSAGGPFFIRSYDEEKDENDLYVLWPFYNRYSDPTKNGTRLIPFFANRNWKDEEGQHARLIAPLWYSRTTDQGTSRRNITLSPLYLSSTEFENADDPQTKTGKGWSFIPPLLWTKTFDRKGSSWNALLLAGGSDSYDGTEASLYFLPLFTSSRNDVTDEASTHYALGLGSSYHRAKDGSTTDDSGSYFFPLYANRRWTDREGMHHRSFSPLHYNHSTDKEQTTILPLFYQSSDEKGSAWNLGFLLGGLSSKSDGDSQEASRSQYFFPFYHYSYDAAKKNSELTYALFFGSRYSRGLNEDGSANDDGSYFFPLYANRHWTERDGLHHRHFSPLHYSHTSDKEHTILAPLYYRSSGQNGSAWNVAFLLGSVTEKTGDSTSYFFPLFVRSYDASKGDTDHNFLWPLGRYYRHGEKADGTTTEHGFYFFPLLSQRYWQDRQGQHSKNMSLLHYYHSYDDGSEFMLWPLLIFKDKDQYKSSWSALLLLGGSSSVDGSRSSYFFPVFNYSYDAKKQDSDLTYLLFFGSRYRYGLQPDGSANDSGSYLFPLYANREFSDRAGRHHRSFSLLHYWDTTTHTDGRKSTTFFSPLGAYDSDRNGSSFRMLFVFSGKSSEDGRTSDLSLFPLFSLSSTTVDEREETSSYFLFPLWLSSTETSADAEDVDRFVLWPLMRYHAFRKGEANTTQWRFFPLFFYTHEDGSCVGCEGSYTTLFPLYFRGRETKANGSRESYDFLFGFYRRDTPAETYHNFFYLYEYERTQSDSKLNFLLGMYHQEWKRDSSHLDMLYGLLVNADWYKDGYDTRWLLYYQMNNAKGQREKNSFSSTLFPLWSYHSNEKDSSFLLVPTLSYHSRSPKETFDCDLFCLGWWRSEDAESYSNGVLLGGVLYLQQSEARNGWKSDGMLWNLLWRYQRESETDYSKVSILAGLYARSRQNSVGYERDLYLWGALYGRESNREKNFEKQSYLWGAIYGSESRANGYRRSAVFWGLFYENLNDPERQYKSWSVLQGILYSNVDNDRTHINYRRILGLQILKGPEDRMP